MFQRFYQNEVSNKHGSSTTLGFIFERIFRKNFMSLCAIIFQFLSDVSTL